MEDEITQLKDRIKELEDIVFKGQYSNKKVFNDRIEMNRNVYVKAIDDISLTSIGDTSAGNESANITANFNKIIGALNNK